MKTDGNLAFLNQHLAERDRYLTACADAYEEAECVDALCRHLDVPLDTKAEDLPQALWDKLKELYPDILDDVAETGMEAGR